MCDPAQGTSVPGASVSPFGRRGEHRCLLMPRTVPSKLWTFTLGRGNFVSKGGDQGWCSEHRVGDLMPLPCESLPGREPAAHSRLSCGPKQVCSLGSGHSAGAAGANHWAFSVPCRVAGLWPWLPRAMCSGFLPPLWLFLLQPVGVSLCCTPLLTFFLPMCFLGHLPPPVASAITCALPTLFSAARPAQLPLGCSTGWGYVQNEIICWLPSPQPAV